jgi:hypothetical protein
MSRLVFLTIASLIAISVGVFALLFPTILLESKGVEPINGTLVWTREVGLLLICLGIIGFSTRKHDNSATLKALLFGNIIIQIGLFLIELIAYSDGIITKISGVIPNLSLHVLLTTGFLYYWTTMKISKA